MKAMGAALGYAVAAAFILLGASEMLHVLYRSFYFDGGMAFDGTGREVPSSTLVWIGPGLFALGVLIAAAVYQLGRKRGGR